MDWNNLQTWQYFALGGAAVLVLGLILYFLPVGKMKIPGGVTAAVGGLATGLALGILFMASYGYKPSRPETAAEGAASDGAPVQMPGAGGPKMMGGGGKGGGGKGGGGPKAPNPRTQLAALVTALDRVADRPVTIRLTPEQRAVLAEQLKGLDTADAISEEEAKTRLDAIHKIVEKDREALEAVGYRGLSEGKGPGGGFGAPKEAAPNPFKEGNAADRLKSLKARLDMK